MLESIIYESTTNDLTTQREITTFLGLPLYRSSGYSSSASDTWFPFHGLNDCEQEVAEGVLPIGWFIKGEEYYAMPKDVESEVLEHFRYKGTQAAAEEICFRFSTLPCLLISSVLGGGLWNDRPAKRLKSYLMKNYPEFYMHFPKLETQKNPLKIINHDDEIEKIEQVNNWLIQHSSNSTIKTAQDLKCKNLISLKDLTPVNARQPNYAPLSTLKMQPLPGPHHVISPTQEPTVTKDSHAFVVTL